MNRNRKRPSRRRSELEYVESLERRELLTASSLVNDGLALHHVDVRIADLSKAGAAADISAGHSERIAARQQALGQRQTNIRAKIHQALVKQMNTDMLDRLRAENKLDHGHAMSPSDDIDITDFSPIAHGVPSELPGALGATFYSPSEIQYAYGLSSEYNASNLATEGKGVTIAIVDAYDDTYINSDLASFSSYYGLPQMDGVGNDPTFTVHNMQTNNSSNYKSDDGYTIDTAAYYGWDGEIALDVEWAHSIAPYANILLVEAASNSNANLYAGSTSAEAYGESQSGVVAITNSWGGSESSSETSSDQYFTTPAGHTPIAFFFSTGDSGATSTYTSGTKSHTIGGTEYPSTSPNVVAVGATSLYLSSARGRYGSETAWGRYIATSSQEGSSGGVSSYEPVPSYQANILSFTKRAVPDISMVGDEDTGNAVIDSDYFDPAEGVVPGDTYFWQYGGTSMSSPQVAAMSAIADALLVQEGLNPLSTSQLLTAVYNTYNSSAYSSTFHDTTSGQTGTSTYAGVGYDLTTGVGTPIAPAYITMLLNTGL